MALLKSRSTSVYETVWSVANVQFGQRTTDRLLSGCTVYVDYYCCFHAAQRINTN